MDVFGVALTGNMLFNLVLSIIGVMAVFTINALFAVWLERKVSAHIQLRLGPMEVGFHGAIQSAADGVKLIGKEIITPKGVDKKLFPLAPYLVFFPSLLMFVVIPFSDKLQVQDLNIGLLYFFSKQQQQTKIQIKNEMHPHIRQKRLHDYQGPKGRALALGSLQRSYHCLGI